MICPLFLVSFVTKNGSTFAEPFFISNRQKDYFQASMICMKSAALRAAPPIKPPSISG